MKDNLLPLQLGKIFLLRHGETEWTKSGRHTGKTDLPLTEQGFAQVLHWQKVLNSAHFDAVFCSPLLRAKETCQALRNPSKTTFLEDLKEWDYGDYEGLTSTDIHKQNKEWDVFLNGAPHGESVLDVLSRANRIKKHLLSIPGRVLVVSHGHFLRLFTACFLDQELSLAQSLSLYPGSLSILGFEKEKPSILMWNVCDLSLIVEK